MTWWVAALVAFITAGCSGSKPVDDWVRQLKDPDVVLRRQACRELGQLSADSSRTAPLLSEALRDESWYVRRDAASALGKLGPDAQSAVPMLIAALKDREKSVRATAAAALKRIDPAAAARAGVR